MEQNFRYLGKVKNGLDRVTVVTSIPIPRFDKIQVQPINFAKCAYMRDRLQKFRSERTELLNKNKVCHAYEIGQIVYMYQAKGSVIQTGSRKIACYFVGPLVMYKAIGPNQHA